MGRPYTTMIILNIHLGVAYVGATLVVALVQLGIVIVGAENFLPLHESVSYLKQAFENLINDTLLQ